MMHRYNEIFGFSKLQLSLSWEHIQIYVYKHEEKQVGHIIGGSSVEAHDLYVKVMHRYTEIFGFSKLQLSLSWEHIQIYRDEGCISARRETIRTNNWRLIGSSVEVEKFVWERSFLMEGGSWNNFSFPWWPCSSSVTQYFGQSNWNQRNNWVLLDELSWRYEKKLYFRQVSWNYLGDMRKSCILGE